jgi:hypothetical protein
MRHSPSARASGSYGSMQTSVSRPLWLRRSSRCSTWTGKMSLATRCRGQRISLGNGSSIAVGIQAMCLAFVDAGQDDSPKPRCTRGSRSTERSDLLHFTDPNLFHYFEKFNRYTSLAAEDLRAQRKGFRLSQLLLRPPWVFVRMYFLRRGFLDGIQGFILSLLSSCYVFVKYAKLWELSASDERSKHQ